MSSEEKLRGLQSEARHLKASIKKYESLVEKYKKKVESDSLTTLYFLKLQRELTGKPGKKTSAAFMCIYE